MCIYVGAAALRLLALHQRPIAVYGASNGQSMEDILYNIIA